MIRNLLPFFVGISIGAISVFRSAPQTEEKALEAADLKTMVANMGYKTKDLGSAGKEKFEFTITTETLDVPISAEITSSKRFIWLSAFLGDTGKLKDPQAKALMMLQKNTDIQPSMFYVTPKGIIMIGLSTENRNVTPAILKWRIDKIVADVVATEKAWSPE